MSVAPQSATQSCCIKFNRQLKQTFTSANSHSSNEKKIKLTKTQMEKQSLTAPCVSVKICDSLSMSELEFLLNEVIKLEEGGESFCSCMGLDTSPLRAIVLCHLLCLTSPETVPMRIVFLHINLPNATEKMSL